MKTEDLIQQALDYGLKNPTTKRCPSNGITLIAETPSGLICRIRACQWEKGKRPPQSYMQNVRQQVEEIGCKLLSIKTEVTNRKTKRTGSVVTVLTPSGKEWKVSISNWCAGTRPPSKLFHNFSTEAQRCGVRFLRITYEPWSDGRNRAVIYTELPDGSEHRMWLAEWLRGVRPLQPGGGYVVSAIERDDEMASRQVTLYYLRFTDPTSGDYFYKIGITARPLKRRFAFHTARGFSYEVVRKWEMSALSAARIETEFLRRYGHHRVCPGDYDFPDGITECFKFDVLGFDTHSSAGTPAQIN